MGAPDPAEETPLPVPTTPVTPTISSLQSLEKRLADPSVPLPPLAGRTTPDAWHRSGVRRWIVTHDLSWAAKIAGAQGPILDYGLPLLGRSANYSRLWMGVAAALTASGDRRNRRGAARGLLGIAIVSPATNLIAKSYTRRPRPLTDSVPVIRRLQRVPITTSFPSGHSASAAAFATGVALESPVIGAPVGVLAGGVALSRVVTAAHFPSDVIAGCAVGVGVGFLTLAFWPRARKRQAATAPLAQDAPTSLTGAGVEIVVNVSAGDPAESLADYLRLQLPEATVTEAEGEQFEKAVSAAADRCEILGVSGGDGSVNTAARYALAKDLPLLLIPGGTLNHFARDLGVPDADAALNALRQGSAVQVEVGQAGDEIFLNTCSAGLYTDMVLARQRFEAGIGKWPAMLLGAGRVLFQRHPQEIILDGHRRKLWVFFAGNNRYQPEGHVPTRRSNLADGLLDARTINADRPFGRLRVTAAVLTGALSFSPVYREAAIDGIKLEAPDGDLVLSLDGEPTSVGPSATVKKSERLLTVFRPNQNG